MWIKNESLFWETSQKRPTTLRFLLQGRQELQVEEGLHKESMERNWTGQSMLTACENKLKCGKSATITSPCSAARIVTICDTESVSWLAKRAGQEAALPAVGDWDVIKQVRTRRLLSHHFMGLVDICKPRVHELIQWDSWDRFPYLVLL